MLTKIKHFFCKADPVNLAIWVIIMPLMGYIIYQIGFLMSLTIIVTVLIVSGILIGIGYGLYRLIKWAQTHCEDSDV